VIYSSLKPGITALITSKFLASEVESSSAQPLAWLSPLIKILFLYGFKVHLFLFLAVAVFSTKPGNLNVSDSSWGIFGSEKRFMIVGIDCGSCASGCLLYFRLV